MKKITILLLTLSLSAFAVEIPNNVYKNATITPQSDYAIYQKMREATKLYRKGKLKESTPLFIQVLQKANRSGGDKNIDQYDYLYAHYAILSALEIDEEDEKKYIRLAKKIISYLDKSTARGIWEEGELGQFQLKVYREVGNKLAQLLYKESERTDTKKMKQAARYIKKAEKYIRSERDFYIRETKEQINNALAGNPPLKSEKEKLTVTKMIKNAKDDNKTLQKQ